MVSSRGKSLIRSTVASIFSATGVTSLRGTLGERFKVLMYHRIVDPETVPFPLQPGMYVRPETFRTHIKTLSESASVISLRELISLIEQGARIPKKTVVITFDDGWLDNLENAAPILQEYDLPATIFLPTAFIGQRDLFWTDGVAATIAWLTKDGGLSSLATFGRDLRTRLPADLADQLAAITKAVANSCNGEGIDLLIRSLFQLPLRERAIYVEQLFSLPPLNFFESIPRMFMNWDEVKQLSKQQVVFGNHTHGHHLLTEIQGEELIRDVELAQHLITSQKLPNVPVFCYPGGAYNLATQSRLADLKIGFAVTTSRASFLNARPALIGRIGMHEDVTHTRSLFRNRIWFGAPF